MNQFFEEAYRIPEINEHEHTVTILAEGVEKYLTTKLYREMFGVNPEIMKENKAMEEKLIRLENLSADDLDALQEVEDHHVWGQAMFELDAMNFFKSPRDKLRCGMRACELLSLALRDVLNKRSGKTTPPPSGQPSSNSNNALLAFGADEFVPCFILLVLRARSYNYYANVRYIDDFRAPQLMNPEESYCLANLMSAAAFWMECDDNGRIASRRRQDRPSLPVKSGGGGDSSTGSPTTGNTEDEKASTSHDRLPPPPSLSDRDLLPSIQKGILVEPLSASSTPKRDKLNTFKQGLKKERDSVLDALFGWSTSTSPKAVATDAPPKEEPAKANTFSEMFYRLTSPNTEKGTVETPVSATVVSKPLPSPAVKKLMSQKNSFEELSVTELKLVFDEMKRICQE
ncbi:hypothetical protein AGDE_14720 [Angomonas deanei]|nr:hypothetical protein AGDE_14720 [Angomonas deanei]|eukprot:EPY20357.1 hypothetical protein AGDE_14720 [Angomonas deanei]